MKRVVNSRTISQLLACLLVSSGLVSAQEPSRIKEDAFQWITDNSGMITGLSDNIWDYAELPMEEYRSSRLLADSLQDVGFEVERGVAGMPTAFVATFGSGEPVLGFLAEYDALPRLSQKAVPYQEPLVEGGSGHGCGHNLLGVGASAAAMAVKVVMEKHNLQGTIKLFGCPNEENDIGKVFMARDGLFRSLSAAVDWHPGSVTAVSLGGSHAIHNFVVTFRGRAAHAGADPWDGRSALDGIEVMNFAVNLMREHVKPTVRVHYAITEGGEVANVVPDYAVAWYNTRDVTIEGSAAVFDRVRKIAEAAGMATETEVEVEFLTAIHQLVILEESSRILQENLELVGPPQFTAEEQDYARTVQRNLGIEERGLHDEIAPLTPPGADRFGGGGTDVAEVSWNAPVLRMTAATTPLGAPGHSWAIVCTGKTSMAHKGMLVASKALAATVLDLMMQPDLLSQVRAEWSRKTRAVPYQSPLPPDAVPPVVPEKSN
jgi:aminobenzoyl-glutamate utilization protein B